LEEYYQRTSNPSVAETEVYASNLGVEKRDVDRWFHYRRLRAVTTSNLQNLKMEDNPPDMGDGIKMVLPHHLNRLLDIMLPEQALVLDLRQRTAFEKSHIYKAVNFRLPSYFVESAEVDMLNRALGDQGGQHDVGRWMNATCIVFYDRAVEYSWECPIAEALIAKLRRKGWAGRGFILKGHYREFASSYSNYIVAGRGNESAGSLDANFKYSVSFSGGLWVSFDTDSATEQRRLACATTRLPELAQRIGDHGQGSHNGADTSAETGAPGCHCRARAHD
jgi:hypothetical protein